MLDENAKWIVFVVMLFMGVTSLIALLLAQLYVKLCTPDIWNNFFSGRSIGFSYDLKFSKFPIWLYSKNGAKAKSRLPRFGWFWYYYIIVNRTAFIPFAILVLDFFFVVYQTGMIGGWRFR